MDAQQKQNNRTFLCTDKKNCSNAITAITHSQQPAIGTAANNCNNGYPFLVLLHNLLSSPGFNDAITWQPHGKSFSVLDQQRFTLMVVMPVGFNMTMDDFYKTLDMWGFKRCLMPSAGHDQCAYYHALFVRDKPQLIGEMIPRTINEPNFYEKSVNSISLPGYHNHLQNGYVSGYHPLPNSEEVYPYPSSRAHVQHHVVPPAAKQSSQLLTSPVITYCEQCTQTDVSDQVPAPQGNAARSGVGVDGKLGSSTALVQDPRYVTPPRQSFQGMASFLSGSPTKKVQAPMPDKVQEKGALLVEANQPLGSSSTTAFAAPAAAAPAVDPSALFGVTSTLYQSHGVSCKKSTSANVLDLTQEAKSITTKTCKPGGLRSRSNSFQPIAEASPATKEVVHPMVLNNDELKLLFCFLSSPDGDGRDVNNLITPDTEADEGETKPSQKHEKKAALRGLYQQARDKARDNKRKREVEVQSGQKKDGRGSTATITQQEDSAKRMKQAKPMCLHSEGCTNPSVEGKGGLCIGHWHEEEMRLKEYQQFYFS